MLSDSFIFYAAFRASGIPLKPTWLYIFSFGIKLVHVGVPTVFCNRGDLNWNFIADSGTQCLRVYLLSFNTVGQGRSCFSLKLLANITS